MSGITNAIIDFVENISSPLLMINKHLYKTAREHDYKIKTTANNILIPSMGPSTQPKLLAATDDIPPMPKKTPEEQTSTDQITASSSEHSVSPWAHNFCEIRENRKLLNDSLNADLEHLVKVKICYDLLEGTKIPLRTDKGIVTYTVYRKIANDGLFSYALTPDPDVPDQLPLIVFRCTEPDPLKAHAFSSMQNDVDFYLGERGWRASEKLFLHLMADRKFRAPGQKVNVCGYSLGGAHAQYFVAVHHARVKHAIFYSNPSINAEVVDQFAKTVREDEREKDPIILQIFRNWGDPVTHVGVKHLGCGVDVPYVKVQLLEFDFPNQDRFEVAQHTRRIFATDMYNYKVNEFTDPKVLEQKLDNTNRDGVTRCFENTRQEAGGFLSDVFGTLHKIKTEIITFIEQEARMHKEK